MPNLIDTDTAKKTPVDDLVKQFNTDKTKGLTASDAQSRIQEYGPNEIPEKKQNAFLKFLKNFWGPIPFMIEAAAVLSAVTGAWADFCVIMFLLIMNGMIEFMQSRKADNAIAMLKASLASKAKAMRDGNWAEIDAKELVPGDIIQLKLGDVLPADVKLVDGDYLLCDEAALTGESLPVEKHPGDVAYSGSVAKQGEMTALVYGTALNTFFGRTAKLVGAAKTKSHFQAAVVKIGQYLIVLNFLLIGVVILDAVFFGKHAIDWWREITFCLVLTVAAIPAALPAVMSVTLAVGALALSKKQAIISKLMAIEEMAGMDILCSDKTGTITQNKLTVNGFLKIGKFQEEDIQLYGALATESDSKDPIDAAVMGMVKEKNDIQEKLKTCKQVKLIPFDPVSKRTEAEIKCENAEFKVSKGAPQVILELVKDKDKISDEVQKMVDEAGTHGYRTLGVGKTNDKGEWEYVGMIELMDPPREDSAETVRKAHELGVSVKMITGDHGAIAKETCKQVGIGPNILEAKSLNDLPDRKAIPLVEGADGFSQVFPEHKFEIVDLLQKNGHIVGMTGDGVNDAPALKKADCGTAVDGATDAAKSAADIVLTLPGLSVIVDAIMEARRIFQRLQSYAIYRIGETIDVLFFTVIAILIWDKFPVNPIMIILLAVFNDFPIMAIAYDNVKYSGKPEQWNMRKVIGISSIVGFLDVGFTLLLFALCYNFLLQDSTIVSQSVHKAIAAPVDNYKYAAQWIKDIFSAIDYKQLQTIAFLQLLIAGNFTIFICRTVGHFWSIIPGKSLFWASLLSKLLISAVCWNWFGAKIGGHEIGGCFGLIPSVDWQYIALIWVYAFVERMIISDFIKVWCYKLFNHAGIRWHRHGQIHKH